MIGLLFTAAGLGVAGLDPTGALFAAGLLTAGARERHVAAYGVAALAGTVVLGTTLSLAVGSRLDDLDWSVLYPGDLAATLVEGALGLALLAWGIARSLRPGTRAPKPRSSRGTGGLALVLLGLLFAVAAVLDPTFVSLVLVAGREGGVVSVVAAHTIWVLVSQAPLALFLVAMARGRHERFVVRLQSWWARSRPAIGRVMTGAALVVGVFFLADAGWWLATGRWLVYN